MEKKTQFTYEEEVAMIEELCTEFDYSFEKIAKRALGKNGHWKEPEFTPEQQTLVMNTMCQEFELSLERLDRRRNDHDTFIYKQSTAPGEDPDQFETMWNGIFSGRPSCSNIAYIMRYFGCEYNNSNTQKICDELLIKNQKEYYKTLV
jgi:hypothetical protein